MKMHFSITGEFLTKHVRSLMVEGDWAHALRTLTVGLVQVTPETRDAISVEHCIQILDGKARLEGTNTVNLVKEDPEAVKEYLEQLAYVYGSIVRVKSGNRQFKWYTPYAFVSNFGGEDIAADYGICLGDVPRVPRTDRRMPRASFYLDDRKNDVAYYLSENDLERKTHFVPGFEDALAFLFKPCDAPPFWYPVNDNLYLALMACSRAHRWLEERGAQQYGSLDIALPWTKPDENGEPLDVPCGDTGNSAKADLLKSMTATTGLDPRAIAGMLNTIMGDSDTESKPEADPHFEMESGYVLPDGTFYGCEYYQHPALAKRILMHIFGLTEEQAGDTEKEADARGWLHIQKSADGKNVAFYMGDNRHATQDQKDAVIAYCKRYGNRLLPKHLLEEE